MMSKCNFEARNEFSTSKKHYLDTKNMFLSCLEAEIWLYPVLGPAGPIRALQGPKKGSRSDGKKMEFQIRIQHEKMGWYSQKNQFGHNFLTGFRPRTINALRILVILRASGGIGHQFWKAWRELGFTPIKKRTSDSCFSYIKYVETAWGLWNLSKSNFSPTPTYTRLKSSKTRSETVIFF